MGPNTLYLSICSIVFAGQLEVTESQEPELVIPQFNTECMEFSKMLKYHADPDWKFIPTKPVKVNVRVILEKIKSISEDQGGAEICMYVEGQWTDHRLVADINGSLTPACTPGVAIGDLTYVENLWTPKFFFPSVHKIKLENSPEPNLELLLGNEGKITYRAKYCLLTPCYIDLREFPMDVADCTLAIFDLIKDSRRVEYHWAETSPLGRIWPVRTAQHYLMKNRTFQISAHGEAVPGTTLYLKLLFKRLKGWYLLQAYTPSYLIIFISWLYNTMGLETRTSRLQLRASLLLALMLLFSNIHRQIPRVGYVKALDVWLLLVLGFLILSCIEDTIVTYLCNRIRHPNYQISCTANQTTFDLIQTAMQPLLGQNLVRPEQVGLANGKLSGSASARQARKKAVLSQQKQDQHDKTYQSWARRIDHVFIFVYPGLFGIANIAYWLYYLQPERHR